MFVLKKSFFRNIFEEENLIEMGEASLTSKRKKTEELECSSLPPKKRHQMKNLESDYNYTVVSYFSHKILEFDLTTEENLRIDFLLLASEGKAFNAPKVLDNIQLKPNNDFISDALVLVKKDVKTLALFNFLINLIKTAISRRKVRNIQILLFRYLSSFNPVTLASHLSHHLIGIIEIEEAKIISR